MMENRSTKIRTGICNDESGATLVEFAIILPTFMLLLFGVMDFGFNSYVRSVVAGAVQEAARDSSLEGAAVDGATDLIDDRLENSVRTLLPNLPEDGITIERLSYFSFADVNRPEAFTDADGNGECDNGELFEDENGNGNWDPDVGEEGLGGARDVVLYTIDVEYDRLFPIYKLINASEKVTISASTVLQNQPYAQQGDQAAITAGTCP